MDATPDRPRPPGGSHPPLPGPGIPVALIVVWGILLGGGLPLGRLVWPEDGLRSVLLAALVSLIAAMLGYAPVALAAWSRPALLLSAVMGAMLLRLTLVAVAIVAVHLLPQQTGIHEILHFAVAILVFSITLLLAESALLARRLARTSTADH
jgi:hypothetical protein